MRHAKSDWEAEWGRDHDRPLNGRGVAAAGSVGRILAERDLTPDLVFSSTAVRARHTAELAMAAGSWPGRLVLDRRLYDSGVEEILELAASAPPLERLMLVGHQPTCGMLVRRLTGAGPEMKTAHVAVIDPAIAGWHGLARAQGRLLELIVPEGS